ncbi:hypothetical protein FRB99_000181 [Tulasnella sp. 403]|nr:hypothetical protein FRB99_000181 [Tulasnella sp. 403]
MGIPKFFRWISERYPLTSQLIEENKIPEFDNFYLDFNSIIHACSHPDEGNAHFRISEEQIYTAIFAYVDHLFGKIKPKKVFFMAVDGVAPRAKMNQQRSRRFRTAKEAKELREAAERKGEKLPDQKAFDTNSITPGTPFMARLSEQLRYFVNKKISEDADWRGIQVILSGHEVPGEGEHKIMEYIRLSKAQPDYNPNVRHCLYGLDADLIMLGLLSHDPHFCLLREEVKFGPSRKKSTNLEAQNFFLLHLALLREYLDHEFQSLSELSSDQLSFDYSLERVIDDFVLLAIFVGNDFLPHLPDFHIHENALERLFDIYKEILPKAEGYIVTQGVINMQRLQLVLDGLARGEQETFLREIGDLNYFKGKQTRYAKETTRRTHDEDLVLTANQLKIYKSIKAFVLSHRTATKNKDSSSNTRLALINDFAARDRTFLTKLAGDLNLFLAWDEFDDEDRNLATLYLPNLRGDSSGSEDDDWGDDEADFAVDRVFRKYDRANVLDNTDEAFDQREEERLERQMAEWKQQYYQEKLNFKKDHQEDVRQLVYRYCEGLQWVMFYYYSGVASWGWFYDYHYAPRISGCYLRLDMTGVGDMTFSFTLGEPFKPFEQLMGVLPVGSAELVPRAYHDLMFDPESPLRDFYPEEFEQDRNGKKNDWEAVVKIPFIDKDRLLKSMRMREHKLTEEERRRNSLGASTVFIYDADTLFEYPSSLPGFFPPIARCRCVMRPFDLPTLDGLHLVEGLCDGVFLGVEALAGFPSLKTLPYSTTLVLHQVNVFQSDSRNQSMVIYIRDTWEDKKTAAIAQELIGQRTFANWPFLQEGMISAVSDDLFRYEKNNGRVYSSPHSPQELPLWKKKADRIEDRYSKRFAVITGEVRVLLHIRPLKGLKRLDSGAMVKEYEGPEKETEQAVQMAVMKVVSEDPRYAEREAVPLDVEYPPESKIIFLGEHAYGVAAQVSSTTNTTLSVMLVFFPSERSEVETLSQLIREHKENELYYPAYRAADMLRLTGYALSRITASLMVVLSKGDKGNLGLNLKFESKSLKVLGYTRKTLKLWEYSEKAILLIQEYKKRFPELFDRLNSRNDDMTHASDLFPGPNPEARVREAEEWLKAQGVRDFEPVPLSKVQMDTPLIAEIEKFGNTINANRTTSDVKKAIIKGIPPNAVLKPSHAVYRLQNQLYNLGDRVTMVQESGSVPLCAKGVVVGLNSSSIDVVWDTAFMSGSTLGGRGRQMQIMVNPNRAQPQGGVRNPTTNAMLRRTQVTLRQVGSRRFHLMLVVEARKHHPGVAEVLLQTAATTGEEELRHYRCSIIFYLSRQEEEVATTVLRAVEIEEEAHHEGGDVVAAALQPRYHRRDDIPRTACLR